MNKFVSRNINLLKDGVATEAFIVNITEVPYITIYYAIASIPAFSVRCIQFE
jgi:hypothetical protein